MTDPLSERDRAPTGNQADRLRATLNGRVPALDGVRGLAIVLVLLHQFNILDAGASLTSHLLTALVEPGWVGVQLFFVLSGFLITGILLDTRTAPGHVRSFYMRRMLRIFPLYYLVLVLAFVVVPLLVPALISRPAAGDQVWYWLYLQNWPLLGPGAPTALGHTWSLAVEEQYYLLWPLAVWALSPRALGRLSLTLVFGALALRVGLRVADVAPGFIYASTVTRADALAMGGLAAILLRRDDWMPTVRRRLPRWAATTALVLAVVAVASHGLSRKNGLTQTLGYSLLALLFAQGIMLAVGQTARGSGRLAAALSWPPLGAIGRVSYGMYLFHLPLHLWATRQLLGGRLAGNGATASVGLAAAYLVGASVAVFALAQLSWHLFEKRLLALAPRRQS